MGDSLATIFVILLAAIIMFVFPLMTMADRTDDISQLTVQTATTDFVDKVRTTGKLSMEDYSAFEEKISATGNKYDIELEAKVLDENPGKKTTLAQADKIGKNEYYSIYSSQILDTLSSSKLTLKEGDIFSASVKNASSTLSQQLKNFAYKVTGNDTYVIAAQHSGYVTANGSSNQ